MEVGFPDVLNGKGTAMIIFDPVVITLKHALILDILDKAVFIPSFTPILSLGIAF